MGIVKYTNTFSLFYIISNLNFVCLFFHFDSVRLFFHFDSVHLLFHFDFVRFLTVYFITDIDKLN